MISVMTNACQKETVTGDKPSANFSDEQSRATVQLIQSFDTKLANGFKSGESLSLDSVVWYVEALQNYHFARPDQQYEAHKVSMNTYTILVENNMVALADMANLNETIEADYAFALNALEGDDKYLKLTDVNLDSITGDTAYISSTNVFGLRLIEGLYFPFQEGEDWIWGSLGQIYGDPPVGRCDGTMVGISDASDQLQWKLNHPVVTTEPYVFVNLETRVADGIMYYNERLYTGWNYPEHNCLTSDTLNHYLQQSHIIINDPAEGLRPFGKEFSHVVIDDYLLMWSGGGRYFHYYTVYYGNKITAGHIDD
ncbi:MAG: hypothetical protein CVT92_12055 [Bacteroidetes bacterium HGW-Bacteroidetes-1]|nr:MAG: hypothetical protein CVT92_12055 [Bacteroidetes bacterium HGW-Bacteroidetes-1]